MFFEMNKHNQDHNDFHTAHMTKRHNCTEGDTEGD